MFKGYKECLELLDNGKIKIGRILAMVRSFEYSTYRDEKHWQMEEDNMLKDALRYIAPNVISKKQAHQKLQDMGQPKR